MVTVAALYVDPHGPYPAMARKLEAGAYSYREVKDKFGCGIDFRIDCWDEARDARLYDGPHPVVAHPPCRNWSRLRHLAKGDDSDCARRAVVQVRRFGGVLEHPAGSTLWDEKFGPSEFPQHWEEMASVGSGRDNYGGVTIEVDQVEWGHVARKRTWLYLVGVPRSALEAPPFPGREPTHCVAWRSRVSIANGLRECSAALRRRTPPLFAEYLVRLARAARVSR